MNKRQLHFLVLLYIICNTVIAFLLYHGVGFYNSITFFFLNIDCLFTVLFLWEFYLYLGKKDD